jgi:hypothetical protein
LNKSVITGNVSSVGLALQQRWCKEVLIGTKGFGRVIIEDSSQVKLPKANHVDFSGHVNEKGKMAACKFEVAFDLLTGEPIVNTLYLAAEQDRGIGKYLVNIIRVEFARLEAAGTQG